MQNFSGWFYVNKKTFALGSQILFTELIIANKKDLHKDLLRFERLSPKSKILQGVKKLILLLQNKVIVRFC